MIRFLPLIALLAVFTAGEAAAQIPVKKTTRPTNLNAQYHRAETAWKTGSSLLEAKARVDQVITALPEDHEALKLRARILLSLDRTEEAFSDISKAANLQPGDAETYAILCEAARKSGRVEAATEAMEKVSSLIIDDPHLQIHLSQEAVALEHFDRAEAFARTALVQAPEDPAAHLQMARVFAIQSKHDDALTVLTNSMREGILARSTIEADTLLAPVLSTGIDQ